MAGVEIIEINYGFVQSQLIVEPDRLTLIDTGVANQAERVLRELERIGRRPADLREIVLTHAHPDHTGSVAELAKRTGAAVLAHRLDTAVVRGFAAICPPILSEMEKPYAEEASSRVEPAPPCAIDRDLEEGAELEIGSGATVLHLPGHTPGSIAVYLRRARVVFCGDAVASIEGRPMVGFFNCDPACTRDSFLRLAEMDVETAYFGHGPPLLGGAGDALRKVAGRIAGAD